MITGMIGAPIMDLWCYVCETKTRWIKDEPAGYYRCAACDYGIVAISRVVRELTRFWREQKLKDDKLNDNPKVRAWLDKVARVIKEKMGI